MTRVKSNAGNLSILCFSSTDWQGIWGSRQQVMLRFARKGYPVLFVEKPVGLEHLLRYRAFRQRKWRRWREGVRSVEENLWIASLPPLLPGRYYSFTINRVNQWLTACWSRHWLRDLGFGAFVLWLYNPEQGALPDLLGNRLSVYHCIDQWIAGTAGRKRQVMTQLERELLRRVDLVFANSLPTFEEKRQFNPHTYRIPSGADVEQFACLPNAEIADHPAMADIPRPRIGYSGHINERLDYGVLECLVRQHSEWSLVLVGDTYPWTLRTPPLRQLRSFPNVYFLGKHPFVDMPQMLAGMDVCLIPYVDDERGHYRSPLKLYEYLAAGKPVVSTDHPEAKEYAQHVYLASSPSAFVEQVERALSEDDEARRWAREDVARQNSWDRRVDDMERYLHERLGAAR